jgi:hypothetical protein
VGLALSALAPACALAADPPDQPPPAAKTKTDLSEVVVNGIPYRETVLPTRLTSNSSYGLNLSVMDTPRNTTLLSTAQLETLNIQDPRAFSYLTSSSYTDSAFGTPNIPRIRGQYADVFYNGMRYSFTDNGYGAPVNFDSIDNISITKGPANVIDGPGPGVGGEVDFLTKRPSLTRFSATADVTLDTLGNHRWLVDLSAPLVDDRLGLRISYSGENSANTYFYGHYMHKNAVYVALRWKPNNNYQADFNTEINVEQYTEEVGINRVNQALIDHGAYLQGAPFGELNSTAFGGSPIPIGSPGNPYSPVAPILTETDLTSAVRINPRVTIDQTPGVSSRALLYTAQLIQTYDFNGRLSLENNTFFAFQNSDNQEPYYYADVSNGSYTIENRLDLKGDFDLPVGSASLRNQFVVGGAFRFAHTNYISDFSAETVSVYDLTSHAALWTYNGAYQLALADAFLYKTPFGRIQYGTPGRDSTNGANTGISDVDDGGLFFQDRIELTPQVSALFGGRIDALQDHTTDPLGGAVCANCFTDLPQSHTTGVYGVGDVNLSLVYRPRSWVSGYLTFDWTQSVNPNGGEGGINAYGQVPDATLFRGTSYLYEAGLKFDLMGDKLFAGGAVFDQKHAVPVGAGGAQLDQANIRGLEAEMNYQPTRRFYATASYSFIQTTLSNPAPFYDYPAAPGTNIDGAALFAIFYPGQKYQDPGAPEHVFNVLANYKFANGLGVRGGAQVTGPIHTTVSGRINVDATDNQFGQFIALVPQSIVNNNGYYKSPVIPWQYTLNAAVFYEVGKYTLTLSVYNLTDARNWQPSPSLYGNDFLVLSDPRTVEVRLQAKF